MPCQLIQLAGWRDNMWNLGPGQHATDCEITAIASVAAALTRMPNLLSRIQLCRIFTDCDPALAMLRSPTHSPGLSSALRALANFKDALRQLPHLLISLEWLPGHEGIAGNDAADASAVAAAHLPLDETNYGLTVPSLRYLKECHTVAARKAWIQEWRDYLVTRPGLKDTIPSLPSTKPHPLLTMGLPRSLTSVALQLASGHALTGEYAERFRLHRFPRACRCGANGRHLVQTRSHLLLHCRQTLPARYKVWFTSLQNPPTELKDWFMSDGVYYLAELLKEAPPAMLPLFGRPAWLHDRRPP